jgi:hypothetical protein
MLVGSLYWFSQPLLMDMICSQPHRTPGSEAVVNVIPFRTLTWHKNSGGLPFQPVVRRDIFDILDCGSILLNQESFDINAVDDLAERQG